MGATDVKVDLPIDIDSIDYSGRSYSTLDIFGATKIVIKAKNIGS